MCMAVPTNTLLSNEQKSELLPIITEIENALAINRQPKVKLFESLIWTAGCPAAEGLMIDMLNQIDKSLTPGVKKMAVANILGKLLQMKASGWGSPKYIPCLDNIIIAFRDRAKTMFPAKDITGSVDEAKRILGRY